MSHVNVRILWFGSLVLTFMYAFMRNSPIDLLYVSRGGLKSIAELKPCKPKALRERTPLWLRQLITPVLPLFLRHHISTDSHHISSTHTNLHQGQIVIWIAPKSNHLFLLPSKTSAIKFICNPFITFWVMLLILQIDRQTNKSYRKHNLLCQGGNKDHGGIKSMTENDRIKSIAELRALRNSEHCRTKSIANLWRVWNEQHVGSKEWRTWQK